jgi:protein-S-isoprenylcysteine O-methyltransferase Ste14
MALISNLGEYSNANTGVKLRTRGSHPSICVRIFTQITTDVNIALNVLAAFAIGGVISLFLSILLSILHRNTTPALLAGLLGSIIYCVRILPQWMPGRRSSAPAPRREARVIPWTGSLNIRNQFIAIAILSLLAIALGAGCTSYPINNSTSYCLARCLDCCSVSVCLSLVYWCWASSWREEIATMFSSQWPMMRRSRVRK